MSRLLIPVQDRKLKATGDVLLRAELTLSIRTNKRTWEPVVFLADSGTEMTTMPAAYARSLDLPMPQAAVPGLVTPSSTTPGHRPRNLLGLTGVIDKLRLIFDGDAGPGAPHGYLIVEKK
jgi:hypothetical protein